MVPASLTDEAVPRVPRNQVHGYKGRGVVGHGGHRGAVVSAVDSFACPRRAHKEYIHPRAVPVNELSFVAAVLDMRSHAHAILADMRASTADGTTDMANYTFAQWTHLVIPEAIVDEDGQNRGILMPMFSCNMYDFLVDTRPPLAQLTENPTVDAFHFLKRFEPLRDPMLVAAVLYQVVHAVALLNDGLPHMCEGQPCTGFSHNDLHLANLLLHYDSGSVLLCDFELVQHNPPCSIVSMMDRAPPLHRHPPHGLGLATSDTWGVGMLAVDILTGIAPFINEEVAKDDFGEGPLLLTPECADGAAVVDWHGNMAEHVYRCRGVYPGECDATDAIYEFCETCLTNTAAYQLPLVQTLKTHRLFKKLGEAIVAPGGEIAKESSWSSEDAIMVKARCVLRQFIAAGGEKRPVDRTRTLPRSEGGSGSSLMMGSATSPVT